MVFYAKQWFGIRNSVPSEIFSDESTCSNGQIWMCIINDLRLQLRSVQSITIMKIVGILVITDIIKIIKIEVNFVRKTAIRADSVFQGLLIKLSRSEIGTKKK